jgi:hypothetical protein
LINQAVLDWENSGNKIKIKPDEPQDNQSSKKLYLLVELIPDPNNRNRGQELFTLRMYSWRNTDDVQCRYTSEEPCAVGTMQKILDKFIASEFDEDDELQAIEFFMPCGLISLKVDQWLTEEGGFIPTILGKEYQVIMRLNRRQQHHAGKRIKIRSSLRQKWKEKWSLFQNHTKSCPESVVWICDHKDYNVKKLCERFTCSDSACLIMTFMPYDPPNEIGLGHAILDAGIPVALCFRTYEQHIGYTETVRNDIKKIISNGNLFNLPKVIHQKRQQANCEEHIGNHLTLIWDDPARTIPKEYHKQP